MRGKIKKLSQARKKQLAVALMGGLGLSALVLGSIWFIEKQKKDSANAVQVQQKQQIQTTDFTSTSLGISEQALWENSEGAKVATLEKQIEELQKMIENPPTPPSNSESNHSPDGLGNPDIVGLNHPGSLPPQPPGSALPSQTNNVTETTPPVSRIKTLSLNTPSNTSDSANTIAVSGDGHVIRKSEDFQTSSEVVKKKGIRPNIEIIEDGGEITHSNTVSRGKFRARDTYIPSGTFFRSVLLGGVDAPTGGEAQNASPHPVLMRVTDFAQLPNRFKFNFRECFVTGQAYGDIAAERAYIRLQNLSCVGTDGRAIDMPVRGYVAGEDGKTGVRGNLVTKQGQILANALLSGILSGMSKGVSESFNVTNTTAFGSTTSVDGNNQYKAGLANGLGSAADRLAQYYIKLADKVFPVIEINAGRTVDIVLTQGVEIDTNETK